MNTSESNRDDKEINTSPISIKEAVKNNRYITPLLLLTISLLVTYIFWNIAKTNEESELRSYFDYRVRDVDARIEHRLNSYEEILRSVRGLYNVSDNVDRIKFRSFFNSLNIKKNYPGIQGVGFSLIVPLEQIKKHTAGIRENGFPDYKIWPEGDRETYTSIIYLEPFKDLNLRAFGYDMFSEPVRRVAMEKSRDSNEPIMSGKIKLVQETGKDDQAGFLIYLPVYKNGKSNISLSEKRSNIIGWVYSPFRFDDFMNGIFGERAADIDVEIYDGNIVTNETKMYDSKLHASNSNILLTSGKVMNLNGREWTVIVKSTPSLELRIENNDAGSILIIGIVISLLLTIITLLIEKKRSLKIISDTERKLIEQNLKESEEELRVITTSVMDAIVAMDNDGNIIFWNPAAQQIFGYNESEVLGKNLHDLLVPVQYHEAFRNGFSKFKQTGKGNAMFKVLEMVALNKSGLEFPIEVSVAPVLQNGKWNAIGIIRDITQRKHTEEELRKNELLFRTIWDKANDGMRIINESGIVLQVNDAYCKLMGKTREEIEGNSFSVSYKKSEQAKIKRKHSERFRARSIPQYLSRDILLWNGGKISLELSNTFLDIPGQQTLSVSVFRDITERKLAENEIKLKNEQLIKLNAEKDKFFSIIAHDLKSPFMGFLGLTELMADSSETFSTVEFIENSKSLNDTAQTLYKLLENLLEWAQIQKGSIIYTPAEVNLSKIIIQSIDSINQRAIQKNISIIHENGTAQKILADEKMLDAVLRNLLSNAVKFTRAGGKVVVKSTQSNNGTIEVSIADNGVGIDEKDVKRLFKIEEKISKLGTDGETSTGLGLLLCKEFVEMHGGKIWVESEINKGSVFYFTIPSPSLIPAIKKKYDFRLTHKM